MKTIKTILKKHKDGFQANLLDGDDIDDCGKAILNAKDVFQWEQDFLTLSLNQLLDEVKREIKFGIKGSIENKNYQKNITKNYTNTQFWEGAIFGEKLTLDIIKKLRK
jgi:hypothetical protein